MPNFSGVNFGKIRKAVKFPVEFPVESKSGRIHSKVSGTGSRLVTRPKILNRTNLTN